MQSVTFLPETGISDLAECNVRVDIEDVLRGDIELDKV